MPISPSFVVTIFSISPHFLLSVAIYLYLYYFLQCFINCIYSANSANLGTAGYVFIAVLVFALVLIVLFRPLFWRLVIYVEAMNSRSMNEGLFCLTLILVFLCAWATALAGLGKFNCHFRYSFSSIDYNFFSVSIYYHLTEWVDIYIVE